MFHVKHYEKSTIYALSTPKGSGAIAIIRISGFDFIDKILKIFKKKNIPKSRYSYFSKIYDLDETVLDEIVYVYYSNPNSYTGEDLLELNIHNSEFIINRVYFILESLGFRLAKQGEFTKRAYLNNKISLSKAEAVNSLINSSNKLTHDKYMNIFVGKDKDDELKNIKDKVFEIYYKYSASVDFVEHENNYVDKKEFLELLDLLYENINKHIFYINRLISLDAGINVVFSGIPNSGKSSIFNKLLNFDRAIVHEEEGTTRDFITESIIIDNYKFNLFDTAGLRLGSNFVEKEGIKRTLELIDKYYYIIHVVDLSKNIKEQKNLVLKYKESKKVIFLYNKNDIRKSELENSFSSFDSNIRKKILSLIKKEILSEFLDIEDNFSTFNKRHLYLLEEINKKIKSIKLLIEENSNFDIIYFELQELLTLFDDLYGKIDNEVLLDKIFGEFCIGK